MSFESYVESVRSSWWVGNHVETIYGTSKSGQSFAVLITSRVWYAIRVIMDEDHRDKKGPWLNLPPQSEWIIYSVHLSLALAIVNANYWKKKLENGQFLEMHSDKWLGDKRSAIKYMPSDCATNPDKYLKPGDLIQSDFAVIANHEGIYIGNGQVVHASGHGDAKEGSRVRVGELYPDFVSKEDAPIRVKVHSLSSIKKDQVFRIRFRKAADIVADAKRFADGRFRDGEYNLLLKNCQHFATLCALGWERCDDCQKFLTVLRNGALLALPYLMSVA